MLKKLIVLLFICCGVFACKETALNANKKVSKNIKSNQTDMVKNFKKAIHKRQSETVVQIN